MNIENTYMNILLTGWLGCGVIRANQTGGDVKAENGEASDVSFQHAVGRSSPHLRKTPVRRKSS
jgi:hypothetical protein